MPSTLYHFPKSSPPGTSSKSTKLVHGGVRYLQKAILELDYEQYKLVKEALHERKIFLETAPYLSHMLPIMLPIYKYVSRIYFSLLLHYVLSLQWSFGERQDKWDRA